MTGCTIRRELFCYVVRVGRGIEIRCVTTCTSVWCVVVITVVASSAIIGDTGVRSVQRIVIIVNGECRRRPTRRCGVAHRAVGRNAQRHVVRIDAAVKICGMASRALCWRTHISAGMAFDALRCHVRAG